MQIAVNYYDNSFMDHFEENLSHDYFQKLGHRLGYDFALLTIFSVSGPVMKNQ